jgi:hypothetical protein
MKTRTLAIVAFALFRLATLSPAQEKGLPKPEPLPAPKEKVATEAPPTCGTRVLWMDYWVPVQTIHAPKEDFVRTEKIATYAIEYKPEERSFPTTVLKPRKITREETVTCTELVTTTDPATGAVTTCMQPVTRTRVVEDVVFEAVPEVQKVSVLVARLVPVTEEVKHKYTLYQWRTDMVKKGCAIQVPGAIVPDTQTCVVPPKPVCLD